MYKVVKSGIFVLLIILYNTSFAQTYIIPNLQRDDFNSDKTWWIFQNQGNQMDPTNKNGYLLGELIDPRNGAAPVPMSTDLSETENVGIMTANQRPIYGKDDIVEARVRIKCLNSLPPGSRGWGFWKSEGAVVSINQSVWFLEQVADPSFSWADEETLWETRTNRTIDPAYLFSTRLDTVPWYTDNTQWHYYKVVRNARNSYKHYIDNVEVMSIVPADFPDGKILGEDYSFNLWNDNSNKYQTINSISGNDTIEIYATGYLDTSRFVVDFVEIIFDNYNPASSIAPSGSRLLREIVNEIDDGVNDGLFKGPFNFESSGGSVVILATGKAEEYDGYDNDDEMKIILNSKDFGFNNSRSWDGDVDQSIPKTIIIDTTLSAGTHSLSFETEVTPILYDATVLGSPNGKIVLNQTLNSDAPGGSDFLWQDLDFFADAGNIIIYISGSADEEPGWNHQNAVIDSTDDDELRLELNGFNYSWENDSASFVGNTLFGDFKTICIKKTVSTGWQNLKIYTNQTPYINKIIVYAENGDASLPVDLTSFSVSRIDNKNILSWTVQSELENAGFNIYRAKTFTFEQPHDSLFIKINGKFIAGRGNASTEKPYTFEDNVDQSGKSVWYILEDISLNGESTKHGPIKLTENILPEKFILNQNYPNPFNPTTNIPFSVSQKSYVKLTIFDSKGKQIKLLLNKSMEQGEHLILWDGLDNWGKRVASGVYFYQINTNGFKKTKKMVFLK